MLLAPVLSIIVAALVYISKKRTVATKGSRQGRSWLFIDGGAYCKLLTII